MRKVLFLSIGVLCFVVTGCNRPSQPSFRMTADMFELMEGAIAPPTEVIWDSVSTVIDKEGIHENFPRNDEEWEIVEHAALGLAESANLLMMEGRAKDDGDWMLFTNQLIDTAILARDAARGKNKDAILEVGEKIYNVCTACHMKYIVENNETQ